MEASLRSDDQSLEAVTTNLSEFRGILNLITTIPLIPDQQDAPP